MDNLDQVSILLGGGLALFGGLLTGLFSLLVQHQALKAEREHREEDRRRDVALFKDKLLQERLAPVYEFHANLTKFIGFAMHEQGMRQTNYFKDLPDEEQRQADKRFNEVFEEWVILGSQVIVALESLDSEDLLTVFREVMEHYGKYRDNLRVDGLVATDANNHSSRNLTNALAKLRKKLDEYRTEEYSSSY